MDARKGKKPAVHILDNLFGPDVDNYSKAMSRTTLRQSLLTNNIANVNTPGYKRKDVSFNITLQGAEKKLGTPSDDDAVVTDQSSIRQDGNNVDMETEVMGLTETQLRYEALTQMTAGYFSDLKTVIKGQ
jgi:flagellar basal-body rod protein FlgB